MFFMIFFILCSVVSTVTGLLVFTPDNLPAELCVFFGTLIGLIFGGVLVCPVAGFCGGAGKRYGHGVVTGTIVEASVNGVIFKTYETKIQQGHGEHTTFLHISGWGSAGLVGKQVVVAFDQYILPDYRRGNSNRYVTSVQVVE